MELTEIANRILAVISLLNNLEVKGINNLKVLSVSIDELSSLAKLLNGIQNEGQKEDEKNARE